MVNTQLKLLFIDVPKTGSSALKSFLLRGFSEFIWKSSTHPAWPTLFCSKERIYSINTQGQSFQNSHLRHEPLISSYLHLSNIKNYFIFTVVRDPFERFISTFLETMLWGRNKCAIKSTGNSSIGHHINNLPDPWNAYPYYISNNYYKELKSKGETDEKICFEKVQARLVFNQLNRIASRGGFNKTGVCDVPYHFWPQYFFTNVTLPQPLNIVFLKHEYLKQDFPIFKKELTYVTGIDISDTELSVFDPTACYIFSTYNPNALHTVEYKFIEELEYNVNPERDEEFILKYPTFADYLPAYEEEKKEIKERWLPTIEANRDLIEHLYDEDYRLYNYTKKS